MSDETREKAESLARKIERKIDALFDPLIREMVIMKWAPEYRAIIWEAIAQKSMRLAIEAQERIRTK